MTRGRLRTNAVDRLLPRGGPAVDLLEPRRLFAAFSASTDFVTEAIATYPDGRILAVGYQVSGGGQRQDLLRRFNPDGSPDNSFGDHGKVVNGVTADSAAYAVVIQPDDPDDPNDGRIFVAGGGFASAGAAGQSFTLSAYKPNGDVVTSFGGGAGQLVIDLDPANPNDSSVAAAIAFQGSKLLIAGTTGDAANDDTDDFALLRYNLDGTPDGSFGDGGKVVTPLIQNGAAQSFRDAVGAMLVEPDGKIAVAGTAGRVVVNNVAYSLVGMARYTADGDLDRSFSGDGTLVFNRLGTQRFLKANLTESSDVTVGLARLPNGKYIIAATTPDAQRDFAMVKLNGDGTTADGFGDSGLIRTSMGTVDDVDAVVLTDDTIALVGTTATGNADTDTTQLRTAVAVYTSAGVLDDDFGDGGKAFFDDTTIDGQPPGVTPQSVGIGGASHHATAAQFGGDLVVARANEGNASVLRDFSIDVGAPAASLSAVPDVTDRASSGVDLQVTFTDSSGVNVSTFAPANLLVQNAAGNGVTLVVATATPDSPANGTPRVATYHVNAPGGAWDSDENGTYTVTLQGGQIADVEGNSAATTVLGSFTVNVPSAAPTATFSATDVNAPGGTSHSFTVTYTDADGLVARGSVAASNITVTGPGDGFFVAVTGVAVSPDADAGTITATYTIVAPGGKWDTADTGEYTVTLLDAQIRDTENNLSSAQLLGTFNANLGGVPGAPVAELTPVVSPVAGAATMSFRVTYTDDDNGIDASTIDTSDFRVIRSGGTQLAIASASVDDDSDGSPRVVTYTVNAPGGSWNAADTGTYTISLGANQVSDTRGNFVASSTLGSFTVALGGGTGLGAASVADVNTRGASSYEFTVNYSPTIGSSLETSTLGDNDILVTGPNGFSTLAQFAGVSGNVVSYRFLPPGGTWNARDAGAYAVSLQSGSVLDTTGGPVGSGPLGTFNVAIAGAGGTSLGTFGFVNGVQTKLTVTDGDGTATLLTLTGGGSGEAFQSGDRIDLVLTGTTGASSLSFKSKGGDGRVKLGDVTVEGGGLRQVSGKTADLSGEFTAGSAVGKMLLGNAQDASITLPADGLTTLQFGSVTNLALTSASPIKSLKLTEWADDGANDVITAPTVAALTAKGDFAADISAQSIGNVKVGGTLDGARLVASGSIGKVTAGSMSGSRIFVGVVDPSGGLPDAFSDFADDVQLLGGVAVKGDFSNSLIAAPTIAKLTFKTVTVSNGGIPFGVSANRVRSGSANANGRITVKNAEDPSQTVGQGDFTIRIL